MVYRHVWCALRKEIAKAKKVVLKDLHAIRDTVDSVSNLQHKNDMDADATRAAWGVVAATDIATQIMKSRKNWVFRLISLSRLFN